MLRFITHVIIILLFLSKELKLIAPPSFSVTFYFLVKYHYQKKTIPDFTSKTNKNEFAAKELLMCNIIEKSELFQFS